MDNFDHCWLISGYEAFADRLSQASKSESYAQASKKPYITAKEPNQLFFDHEFTKLYKSLEVQLLNSVTKGDEGLYLLIQSCIHYYGSPAESLFSRLYVYSSSPSHIYLIDGIEQRFQRADAK